MESVLYLTLRCRACLPHLASLLQTKLTFARRFANTFGVDCLRLKLSREIELHILEMEVNMNIDRWEAGARNSDGCSSLRHLLTAVVSEAPASQMSVECFVDSVKFYVASKMSRMSWKKSRVSV